MSEPASTERIRNPGRRAAKIQPSQTVGVSFRTVIGPTGQTITKFHAPGTVIRMAKRGGGVCEYVVDRFGCLRRV